MRPQNRESILAAKILMVLSASIIFTLGVVHLVYTFWGTKLTPRDPALEISMSQTSPVITKETTVWRCWVGFNASHSMGLILFGLVFGFLALAHSQFLFQSPFLLVVGVAMLAGLVVLCKVYFFSVPDGLRRNPWAGLLSTYCSHSHSSKERLRERGSGTRSRPPRRKGCGWEAWCHSVTI